MEDVEKPDTSVESKKAPLVVRILKWFGIVLLLSTLGLVLVVWVSIGTASGRHWLADTVVNIANRSPDLQVNLEGLESPSLGRWQFSSLQVWRNERTWLDAERLELVWQPKALLRRRISIDRLTLDQLHIYATDDQSVDTEEMDESASVFPDLEALDIPEIRIQRFELGVLRLLSVHDEQAIESQQEQNLPEIGLKGEVSLLDDSAVFIDLNASINGISPTVVHVQLTEKTERQLLVVGKMVEPPGGFFGQKLRLPEGQSIDSDFRFTTGKVDIGYQINIETLTMIVASRDLSLQGELSFSGDLSKVELGELLLNIDDTQHQVQGSLQEDDIDFALTLDRFPLDLLSTFDLLQYESASIEAGELSGQINLGGTLDAPNFKAETELNARYNDQALSAIFQGDGNTENVIVEQLDLLWGQARLTAKGNLDISSDNSDLTIQANDFDLGALRDFGVDIPEDADLRLTVATGQLHGSLKDPDADLRAQINGQYRGELFNASAELQKTGSILTVDEILLVLDESRSFASGTVDIDTLMGDLSIDTEPLSIQMIEMVGVALPKGLDGLLEGRASVSGDLRNPAIQANLSLVGNYQDIPYSALARGSREDNIIDIRTVNLATFEDEVLSLQGTVNETDMDIRLKADRLPTQLLSAIGFNVRPGEFSADFQGLGPITLPQIQGSLNYKADFVGYNEDGDPVSNELVWQLDVDTVKESYALRSIFSRSGTKSGELLVNVPAKPYMSLVNQSNGSSAKDLPLNLLLDGNFSLQTLSFFLDPEIHRIQGDVATNLEIGGSLGAPRIKGDVRFERANYDNPISGTQIDNLNCSIVAESTVFNFDKCTASDGGTGSFEVLGDFTIPRVDDSGDVNIELRVNQASILQRPEIESEATGSIQVQGDFETLLAKGALEVAPLEASIDANISSGIPRIKIEKVQSFEDYENQEQQQESALPIINLDLLITATRQAYIRGRGLQAELKGEISLNGTATEPRYEGEFNTVRGSFEVFGKEFDLQDGLVNFANDAIGLSIEGVYERRGQRINALISGTVDDLEITLSATPSMAEDEILAFIIFGKSVQSITPFEAIQLASAVQQLRGGGGFDPIGAARDALGVDRLSIESETLEDDSTGINVGVGKYLNEKVYLELERTSNPSQPWKGSLEIEVSPNINLESSTGGSTGIEGAEIKWTKDY